MNVSGKLFLYCFGIYSLAVYHRSESVIKQVIFQTLLVKL